MLFCKSALLIFLFAASNICILIFLKQLFQWVKEVIMFTSTVLFTTVLSALIIFANPLPLHESIAQSHHGIGRKKQVIEGMLLSLSYIFL